jgi:hypothetical protein
MGEEYRYSLLEADTFHFGKKYKNPRIAPSEILGLLLLYKKRLELPK